MLEFLEKKITSATNVAEVIRNVFFMEISTLFFYEFDGLILIYNQKINTRI